MKVGIDIVNNHRIQSMISESFIKKILNEREIEEYDIRNNKLQYLSGRLAAKEAIIKCITNEKITSMKDIIILSGKCGEPCAHYKGYKIELSISHEIDNTIAIAIIQE